MNAAIEAVRNRTLGLSPTGTVFVRDFDRGIVETLGGTIIRRIVETPGGKIIKDNYYLTSVPNVTPPPGAPGIPITFAYPEDVWEEWRVPVVVLRRDDLAFSAQRWHPGLLQYRAPAAEAAQVSTGGANPQVGYDRVEQLQQAVPYDISYTLSIMARQRGGGRVAPHRIGGLRNQVDGLLRYVLRIYQPYSAVGVIDSIGDLRSYSVFNEGMSILDEMGEVADRLIGYGLTLRVEAELDLNDPEIKQTVTQWPSITAVRG